jgi:hypothetical protein
MRLLKYLASAFLIAAVLAGCSGNTTAATNVASTTATLNSQGQCDGGTPTPCSWYWRYGTGGNYQSTTPVQGPTTANTNGKVPLSANVTGLTPGATYQYQICGKGDNVSSFVCVGSDGTPNTSTSFTTQDPVTPNGRTISAQRFSDSIGVGTHDTYFDTTYGNWTQAIADAKALGVHAIRVGISRTADAAWNQRHWNDLKQAVAAGLRLDVGFSQNCSYLGPGQFADCMSALIDNVGPSGVDAIEWPNEATQDPNISAWGQQVYNLGSSRNFKVYGPSFGNPPPTFQQFGDHSSTLDFGNLHDYTGATSPTPQDVQAQLSGMSAVSGSKPIVATEFGFWRWWGSGAWNVAFPGAQPPIDESGQAVYTLRQFLEHLAQGIDHSYYYELLDEFSDTNPEHNFGLFRTDNSIKPAGTALQNLTTLLGSGAPTNVTPLNFQLERSDQLADLRYLTIEKPDGSYDVVLWRTASVWNRDTQQDIQVTPNTINIYSTASTWVAYDPIVSTQPYSYGGGSARIQVGADPIVLHITP